MPSSIGGGKITSIVIMGCSCPYNGRCFGFLHPVDQKWEVTFCKNDFCVFAVILETTAYMF